MARKPREPKSIAVEALRHEKATRKNIPTMELQSFVGEDEVKPLTLTYDRRFSPDNTPELYARNPDLDPQLVWAGAQNGGGNVHLAWKGKDEEDRDPAELHHLEQRGELVVAQRVPHVAERDEERDADGATP